MNRSLFRAAACTLAAAAATLALLAVPASSPSQAASFTLSDANCSSFTLTDNGGGNFTLNCQTVSPGQFSCSPSYTANPALTSSDTIKANCTNGTGAITYAWSAGGSNAGACPAIGTGASQETLAAPGGTSAIGPCTYNLTATDSLTPTANTWTGSPAATINYSAGGGGGGGGGTTDTSACTAAGLTPHVISVPWASQLIYTSNSTAFGASDAIVLKFTTPATIPAGTGKGYVQAVEYGTGTSPRTGSLSSNPCEFGLSSTLSGGGFANTTAPWIYFKLPGSLKTALSLQANTTYYFNIMNTPGSCTSGSCDMLITMSKPSGS